jgi:hypothetical protein
MLSSAIWDMEKAQKKYKMSSPYFSINNNEDDVKLTQYNKPVNLISIGINERHATLLQQLTVVGVVVSTQIKYSVLTCGA